MKQYFDNSIQGSEELSYRALVLVNLSADSYFQSLNPSSVNLKNKISHCIKNNDYRFKNILDTAPPRHSYHVVLLLILLPHYDNILGINTSSTLALSQCQGQGKPHIFTKLSEVLIAKL